MVTTRRGNGVDVDPATALEAAKSPRAVKSPKAAKSPKLATSPHGEKQQRKQNPSDLVLKHVLVLFRHGDRSPITTQVGQHLVMDAAEKELWASKLPSDEHIEKLSKGAKVTGMEPHLPPPKAPRDGGTFPNGQLTVRGLQQMEAKGEGLRAHYSDFLADIHEKDVYIRSTNVRRTIRSCLALLHGCFPELVGNDRLHIRINTDVTLEPSFTQADYGRLLARYKDPSHVATATLPPLPDTIGCTQSLDKDIRKVIGIHDDQPICYTSLREVLVCRHAHDVPFPSGMDRAMYNKLVDYNTWEFHALFGDAADCYDGFQKGVAEIFHLLHAVTQGQHAPRASLMAVHDSTLIALWNAMQLDVGIVFPTYAALTAIELYQHNTTKEWVVEVQVDHSPVHFRNHKHAIRAPFAHVEAIVHAFLKKEKATKKRSVEEDGDVEKEGAEGAAVKKAKVADQGSQNE
ncbi:hypothetical protein DYB30_004951 [Aphanomyces astaci]|uniref:Histidine acid phosphatase n=2 Tax=Aphanomyces astaci TaxID=112090 RepID=A0A397DLH9_APHAT|nr:hypothetical protein DYB30_004951 [Aphanomyces astaci]RHY57423.1 hypothetical protein DYB34_000007 [Aphanomyces astaci]RHY64255.1 hypothetical protein DYB38_006261 [Aphanomyces astaci]